LLFLQAPIIKTKKTAERTVILLPIGKSCHCDNENKAFLLCVNRLWASAVNINIFLRFIST
jgi:hypothetical protein